MNCLNQSLRTLRFDFELTVFNSTDEQIDDKVLLTHTFSIRILKALQRSLWVRRGKA